MTKGILSASHPGNFDLVGQAYLAGGSDTQARHAKSALRMIREVVEQHPPPGSVPGELAGIEHRDPPFAWEAEAIVQGILAIIEAKRR